MRFRNHVFSGLLSFVIAGEAAQAAESPKPTLANEQFYEFTYQVKIPPLTAAQLPLKIFVPMAPSNEKQSVLSREIITTSPELNKSARLDREPVHGNEYWSYTATEPRAEASTVTFQYKILRRLHTVGDWKTARKATYKSGETDALASYLKADARVPVDGELVTKLRKEIPKSATTPMDKSFAIYNYVVDQMEYKKVGTGWGNGDTYWACNEKYGNCTDFHALVTSMSRAEGIPTRFEMGFPVPQDKTEGAIAGYHCWVQLYLPQVAWMPIDASEAKKHPEQRDLLFGTQPVDRILFSTGRDLVLTGMEAKTPINFFIYPHVEHKGEVMKDLVKTEFRFRVLNEKNLKASL